MQNVAGSLERVSDPAALCQRVRCLPLTGQNGGTNQTLTTGSRTAAHALPRTVAPGDCELGLGAVATQCLRGQSKHSCCTCLLDRHSHNRGCGLNRLTVTGQTEAVGRDRLSMTRTRAALTVATARRGNLQHSRGLAPLLCTRFLARRGS